MLKYFSSQGFGVVPRAYFDVYKEIELLMIFWFYVARSNVVTEDMSKLFVKKQADPSSG